MNFDRLGTFVSRHWVLVLLSWLVLAVGLHIVSPRWDDVTHDGDFAYLPDEMTSVRGEKLLEKAFPDNYSKSQVAIVVARPDGKLTPADFEVMDRLIEAFPAADDESLSDDTSADDASAEANKSSEDMESSGEKEKGPAEEDGGNPIVSAWNYNTPIIGQKLISPVTDLGQAVLLVLHIRNEFMAIDNMDLLRRMHEAMADEEASKTFPKGLKLGISGSAAIGSDILFSSEESINSTELTTVTLVIVILLLVYRAPGLVMVPLVAIGVSVFVASDLVASITYLSGYLDWIDFKIFRTTKIFVIVILFGAGTDYCLFLIARYKEELQKGLSPEPAMARALGNVGSALAASALTTIFGLGMMVFADFGKFSNSGPAIALCLTVALAACITLAPALLRGLGGFVFWPFATLSETAKNATALDGQAELTNAAAGPRFGRFWQRLSNGITARPGLILAASLLIMLPITRPVRVLLGDLFAGRPISQGPQLTVPVTYDFLNELRADRPSVRGARLLWQYFPADQASPVTIVAYDKNTDFDSKAGRRKLAFLTRDLSDYEYVDSGGNTVRPILSVRSLSEPLGDRPGSRSLMSQAGRRKLAALRNPRTVANYVSQTPPLTGNVTRLELVFPYNPFSQESIRLLTDIEKWLQDKSNDAQSDWYGTTFDLVGTTRRAYATWRPLPAATDI